MKKEYNLYIPRKYAVMYLAWELGLNRVIPTLKKLSTDHRGWVNMADFELYKPILKRGKPWLKRELEGFANHVRSVVAYQEGRLGKGLTGGGACIEISDHWK